MQQRFPMTTKGAKQLRETLDQLMKVARPKVIQAISEARAHGDLKENAEYHAAREQQSFIEGRIQELESKLSAAQVIDISTIPCRGKVIFGATISISDVDTEEELTYQIVGADEADIKAGKISVNSPIARALVGKDEGETVAVKTPNGIKEYEILSVKHL